MKIVKIQFAKWDKAYDFKPDNLVLAIKDKVIVETEMGLEIGEVTGFGEVSEQEAVAENSTNAEIGTGAVEIGDARIIKPVLRQATIEDLEKLPTIEQRNEAFDFCKEAILKRGLEMKLVDISFSFSGNRINFAFIADGRVDFRDLVKDLTAHFNKMIRLTQIGIRDEARFIGDCGHCGRPLCCRGFIKDFSSVGSEMAEAQQVVHRGSERLSGCCGRLMCCLQYEYQGYKELAEKMPTIGQKVNVDGKRGVVIGLHVLKQSVDVEFRDDKEGRTITEVDLNRKNK